MQLVRAFEAGVVDVEGVRVLHDELTSPEQSGAGTSLVAVFRLDLVQEQRKVLVGRVEVLHQEREHLLVRRPEQHVVAPAVLEPEDAVAVLGPAAALLVGLARQQAGEVHLLRADRLDLLADDLLDVAEDLVAQRQPRVDAGRGAADVTGADEQPVARDLGVHRILTQGAQEQGGHTDHGDLLGLRARRSEPGQATGRDTDGPNR
jgi:hypothetical protein